MITRSWDSFIKTMVLEAMVVWFGLLSTSCSPSSSQVAALDESRSAVSVPAPTTAVAPSALPDFATLVDQFGKAVVNIEVVRQARGTGDVFALPESDPFYDFFRRFGIPGPFAPPDSGGQLLRGAGSGFIVSGDGYILTNAHVVADADEVTVRLIDRREFQAKVIGTDARTDVAVLKIEARDLPVVRIGNEAALRPGEWVLAIGSPFGLENSVTAGIVSATSRAVSSEVNVPFIQTDVAVNPGNSGGPLFNLRGEVVGINSMIFSRTGGYMGISFAIPIDVAMDVREQLVKTGRVVRGRIGVVVQDVDAALAASFGLGQPRGALVSSVEKDGPAERAGIQPGDVILRVDDRAIDRTSTLSQYVARRKPGDRATLAVWRDGRERTYDVRIAELREPGSPQARASGSDEDRGRLGLVVQPLTSEEREAEKVDSGLRVVGLGDPAAAAGVRAGDIVLAVNSRSVRTVEQLRQEVSKVREGGVVALLVLRNGARIFIPVRLRGPD
jgi:serine protease Do